MQTPESAHLVNHSKLLRIRLIPLGEGEIFSVRVAIISATYDLDVVRLT